VVFNLLAVGAALYVSRAVTLMVLAAIGLLAAYNFYLKRIPLLGNAVIALLGGMTFMTGGVGVDPKMAFDLPGPLIPAVFAFLLHLVREIIKDIEDIEGDMKVGVKTLPQVIGRRRSVLAAMVLFFVLVILTYVPIATGWFGKSYKIITVYFIDLPMLFLLILIWGNPVHKMLKAGSLALKFCMVLGVIALVLA
jgi:geranylgeranylglycerol-phosphate geranylgeranyltransferase